MRCGKDLLRDFMDQAEKIGLIDDADIWMKIRELRDQSAHEYLDEKLAENFGRLRDFAPHLLNLEKMLG